MLYYQGYASNPLGSYPSHPPPPSPKEMNLLALDPIRHSWKTRERDNSISTMTCVLWKMAMDYSIAK